MPSKKFKCRFAAVVAASLFLMHKSHFSDIFLVTVTMQYKVDAIYTPNSVGVQEASSHTMPTMLSNNKHVFLFAAHVVSTIVLSSLEQKVDQPWEYNSLVEDNPGASARLVTSLQTFHAVN